MKKFTLSTSVFERSEGHDNNDDDDDEVSLALISFFPLKSGAAGMCRGQMEVSTSIIFS